MILLGRRYLLCCLAITVLAAAPVVFAAPAPPAAEPPPGPAINVEPAPVPKLVHDFKSDKFEVAVDRRPQKLLIAAEKPIAELDTQIGTQMAVEVVRDRAELRKGRTTIAQLPRGRKLYVTAVQDGWAGTTILVRGVPQAGWVRVADLKPLPTEPRAFRHLHNASGQFVSAAMLVQKAKQFDDGLYAAVELAAQKGTGNVPSKAQLLADWSAALEANPGTRGLSILLAAQQVGGLKPTIPAPQRQMVGELVQEFESDERRSKPLGSYTWSPELSAIFRQDRMLQTPMPGRDQCQPLAHALRGDQALRNAYAAHLQIAYKLTNPPIGGSSSDLVPLVVENPSEDISAVQDWHILPPSISHETALFLRHFGDKMEVPDDFNLMQTLIDEIRKGGIDLRPRPISGWYDYQTWALEPLLLPEKAAESSHLQFNDEYRKLLEELFKGTLALTRETHVKQLAFPAPSAAALEQERKPELYISPDLVVEPLPTYYARRAQSYAFVETVLLDLFGEDGLAQMHRQTIDGPVKQSLADELREMRLLFYGAHVAASRQIGRPEEAVDLSSEDGPEGDAEAFMTWAAATAEDPDLARDSRMMVPVFNDPMKGRVKVWCMLGWQQQRAWASYVEKPKVAAVDESGAAVELDKTFDVIYSSQALPLASPIFAEVWVTKLLNRDEFRRHCDTYVTPEVILANLE